MARQTRSQATRAKILRAAEACFAQHGYEGTGVAEICQRAGVGKGGFYYHFPSKQAVFIELLDQWLAGLDAQLAQARDPAQTVAAQLEAMALALGPALAAAHDRHLRLILEFWSQAVRQPRVRAASTRSYKRYERWLADLIASGVAEGSLRPVDAGLAARALIAYATGLLLHGLLAGETADWGQVAQEGVRLLLGSLKRD